MSRHTRITIYAGIAVAGAGFLLIGLAWNGAASYDYGPAQFPYLISGGLTGLGLIILGVTVMVAQIMQHDSAERAAELERLRAAIAELHVLLIPPDADDSGTAQGYRPRPRSAVPTDNKPPLAAVPGAD